MNVFRDSVKLTPSSKIEEDTITSMDGFVKAGLIVAGILLSILSPFMIISALMAIGQYYYCESPYGCGPEVLNNAVAIGMIAGAVTVGAAVTLIIGTRTPETLPQKALSDAS